MLKVGFIVLTKLSESLGYSLRPLGIIKALASKGIKVHVFTPFHHSQETMEQQNIIYHRIPITSSGKISSQIMKLYKTFAYKRMTANLFYNSFIFNLLIKNISKGLYKTLSNYKEELDIVQCETEFPALALINMKNKLNIPIVVDLHDIRPLELEILGICRSYTKIWRFSREITIEIIKNSSATFVVSEGMKKLLIKIMDIKKESDKKRIHIISNAAFKDNISLYNLRLKNINEIYEKPREINVAYIGALETWEGLDLVIKSVSYLRDLPIKIFIIGSGTQEKSLKRIVIKENIEDKVIFLGYIPRRKALFKLINMHAGLVTTPKIYAQPLKFYEYLSLGIPVLSTKGEWTSVLKSLGIGYIIPRNPSLFANTIMKFFNNRDIFVKKVIDPKYRISVYEKYTWDAQVDNLIKIYKELLST